MEVYAKQARDGKLIGYATEIRKRAERRLGELMEADRKAGKLSKGNAVKGAKPGPGRGKKGQKHLVHRHSRSWKRRYRREMRCSWRGKCMVMGTCMILGPQCRFSPSDM
jgi:hypothetical protein